MSPTGTCNRRKCMICPLPRSFRKKRHIKACPSPLLRWILRLLLLETATLEVLARRPTRSTPTPTTLPMTQRYLGFPWWWRSVPIVIKNRGRVWPPRRLGKPGPPAGASSSCFGRFVGYHSWWTVAKKRNTFVSSVDPKWPKSKPFRIVVSSIEASEMVFLRWWELARIVTMHAYIHTYKQLDLIQSWILARCFSTTWLSTTCDVGSMLENLWNRKTLKKWFWCAVFLLEWSSFQISWNIYSASCKLSAIILFESSLEVIKTLLLLEVSHL